MTNNSVKRMLSFIAIITLLFFCSCTSTRVIKAQPDTVWNEVKEDEIIRIVTTNGSRFYFRIAKIDTDTIIGHILKKRRVSSLQEPMGVENQQIFFYDIDKIEIR